MGIKYLLSGPDIEKGFEGEIVDLLKNDLRGKRNIYFISSTPDNYEMNDLFFNNCKRWFDDLGLDLNKYLLIDNRIVTNKLISTIKDADIIFLLGGDPFEQIGFLKNTKIDKFLKKFDGIIMGVSAGAMNMGNKVYYSKDDDYPESVIYDGLNLVDITIDPHFDPNNKDQISEFLKFSENIKIIGLPNISSIRVSNEVKFIGEHYIAHGSQLVLIKD